MVSINPEEFRRIIAEVQIRPVDLFEVQPFDELLARHHYLGFQRAAGQSIRYVACWQDQWLALLLWASAAFKCKARDQWIGWQPYLQWARLTSVVNNTRFLMLPGVHVPNLASRILRLNRERIVDDWHERYGSTVLLAETFVDPSRYRGSCYLADNWLVLGQTRGFSRKAGKYTDHHAKPKLIFVHLLHPRGREILSDPADAADLFSSKKEVILDCRTLTLTDWSSLFEAFAQVRDTRTRRGRRHRLPSVLAIVTCAFLSGCRVVRDMEFWAKSLPQKVLGILRCPVHKKTGRREAPSDSTILRVLQQINTANLDDVVSLWLTGVLQRQDEKQTKKQPGELKPLRAISLDGKTLKGSHDGDKKAVQLFSALWQSNGVVIGQVKIPEETNEINALAPLLGDKDIEGCVVTADAIHTQGKSARYVVERKKADYLLTVKANQPTLLENLQAIDDGFFSPGDI